MKFLVLLAYLCVTAYGANHNCWTLDQIAAEVIRQTDTNHDGVLQQAELTSEFIDNWNLGNDSCLSYHDFTTNWMNKFHDHHDTAHAFYNNLDLNKDGKLCLYDVAVNVLIHDQNPVDGQIQQAEFLEFLHAVHPDSHQNGGHGHGC